MTKNFWQNYFEPIIGKEKTIFFLVPKDKAPLETKEYEDWIDTENDFDRVFNLEIPDSILNWLNHPAVEIGCVAKTYCREEFMNNEVYLVYEDANFDDLNSIK